MLRAIRLRAGGVLGRAGRRLLRLSAAVSGEAGEPGAASELVAPGDGRNLYRTPSGDLFWLDASRYLDRCIVQQGVFEKGSTEAVRRIVRSGDVALDVGANIGYYSVLLARLVGPAGRVVCFEPTLRYEAVLRKNLEANGIANAEVHRVGLSDVAGERPIQIDESSATLHPVAGDPAETRETVRLQTLDDFARSRPFGRIDFIKVDIDGHEPHFLAGARETLERFEPVIMLEIAHLNYLAAGHTAWDFYERLRGEGYRFFADGNLDEIRTQKEFLMRCGNFAYSANVFIARRDLPASPDPDRQGVPGGRQTVPVRKSGDA